MHDTYLKQSQPGVYNFVQSLSSQLSWVLEILGNPLHYTTACWVLCYIFTTPLHAGYCVNLQYTAACWVLCYIFTTPLHAGYCVGSSLHPCMLGTVLDLHYTPACWVLCWIFTTPLHAGYCVTSNYVLVVYLLGSEGIYIVP